MLLPQIDEKQKPPSPKEHFCLIMKRCCNSMLVPHSNIQNVADCSPLSTRLIFSTERHHQTFQLPLLSTFLVSLVPSSTILTPFHHSATILLRGASRNGFANLTYCCRKLSLNLLILSSINFHAHFICQSLTTTLTSRDRS
jgi:hypothetical protein